MSIGSYLMSQFAQPHGPLGGLFGSLLNRGNRLINRCSLEALEVGSGQRVLDVGFGGGAALEILLAEKDCGYVAGLDPSETMVRAAERRLAPWIEDGRLAVRRGTAEDIPWPGTRSSTGVLSVNSLPYWPDPPRGVREIARVLRAGRDAGPGPAGRRRRWTSSASRAWATGRRAKARSRPCSTSAGFVVLSAQSHREAARGDFVIFRARRAV